VVTKGVKRVDVEARTVGAGKAFAEFKVENVVTKALALDQIAWASSKSNPE
jgi:hypothetical protein